MELSTYQTEVKSAEPKSDTKFIPIGALFPGQHYCRIENVVVDSERKIVSVLFSELTGAGWFESEIPFNDLKKPFPAMFLFVGALFDTVPYALEMFELFKTCPEEVSELLIGLGIGLVTELTDGLLMCQHDLGAVVVINSDRQILARYGSPDEAKREAKVRGVEFAKTVIKKYSCQYGKENEAKLAERVTK